MLSFNLGEELISNSIVKQSLKYIYRIFREQDSGEILFQKLGPKKICYSYIFKYSIVATLLNFNPNHCYIVTFSDIWYLQVYHSWRTGRKRRAAEKFLLLEISEVLITSDKNEQVFYSCM